MPVPDEGVGRPSTMAGETALNEDVALALARFHLIIILSAFEWNGWNDMKREVTIGVIADTHGLVRPELFDQFKGVDYIVHAGDVGSQEVLDTFRKIAPVRAVRGNADKGEWAESLPLYDLFEIAGHFIYLIHDLNTIDLDPQAAGIHVVISGHSHQPGISRKKGICYLNPGSAGPRRFKLPVSAALLRLECGAHINAKLLTMEHFIEQAVWKESYRLSVRFDNGITKTVNLESAIEFFDQEYFRTCTIDPYKGSMIWPGGERYTADKLYEAGIRCRMDFDEPTIEWYLSCFDEHLDGAEVLFAASCVRESDHHWEPVFILISQHGRLYKVEDEIVDGCDPSYICWDTLCQKTCKESLLYAIEHEGLGIIEGKDQFAESLRQFLNSKDFDHETLE